MIDRPDNSTSTLVRLKAIASGLLESEREVRALVGLEGEINRLSQESSEATLNLPLPDVARVAHPAHLKVVDLYSARQTAMDDAAQHVRAAVLLLRRLALSQPEIDIVALAAMEPNDIARDPDEIELLRLHLNRAIERVENPNIERRFGGEVGTGATPPPQRAVNSRNATTREIRSKARSIHEKLAAKGAAPSTKDWCRALDREEVPLPPAVKWSDRALWKHAYAKEPGAVSVWLHRARPKPPA